MIRQTDAGYLATAPDVPGCTGEGWTREEAAQSLRDSIDVHFDQLMRQGIAPPKPSSSPSYLDVI